MELADVHTMLLFMAVKGSGSRVNGIMWYMEVCMNNPTSFMAYNGLSCFDTSDVILYRPCCTACEDTCTEKLTSIIPE